MLRANCDVQQVQENLELLKLAVQKRVLRKGVRAGIAPMIKALKSAVPVKLGHLKKAIKSTIKTSKRKGTVYALAGPSKEYSKVVDGKTIRPSKYAPIVEAKRKKGAYGRPAFMTSERQGIDLATEKIAVEVEAEIGKLKK